MHPVMWGWAIVNFVWWIGIGHAGTLISAILFLLRQRWRTAVNRAAEAMTIFAVMCAGHFPGHPRRTRLVRLVAVPAARTRNGIWPQFRSPLMWDVFAVSTYFTVSVLFWYVGLIPDLAIMRDRAKTKVRQFLYGLFALGWTGSNRHWSNYEKAYLILAGLATPLVLSVHSIVSLDFSVSQLPGWHTTIFPPYFVAGAIYSGFGMVLTLLVPLRKICKLEEIITMRHIDLMCKVTLATGSIVGYAYVMEYFIAWYSGNPYERWTFWHRLFGTYWYGGWAMLGFNALVPQLFWFKKVPAESGRRLHHLHPGEHRHVVRAVRDRRRLALPGFPAGELGLLQADVGGRLHLPRHVRAVLHVVPVVHAVPAADRHFGSQRRDAAGRPASPARRRQREEAVTDE